MILIWNRCAKSDCIDFRLAARERAAGREQFLDDLIRPNPAGDALVTVCIGCQEVAGGFAGIPVQR